MIIVGIDPGRHGALVSLGVRRTVQHFDGLDDAAIVEIVTSWCEGAAVVVVEAQQVRARQSGGLRIGFGFGLVVGAALSVCTRVETVAPRIWQEAVLGIKTHGDKSHAVAFTRANYPDIDLTPGRRRVPHDGIADAVCLAHYGRMITRERTCTETSSIGNAPTTKPGKPSRSKKATA